MYWFCGSQSAAQQGTAEAYLASYHSKEDSGPRSFSLLAQFLT